jgi:hypothetical protein
LRELADQVLLHEPGALVYYFFYEAEKNEIIAIEKYVDFIVFAHPPKVPHPIHGFPVGIGPNFHAFCTEDSF